MRDGRCKEILHGIQLPGRKGWIGKESRRIRGYGRPAGRKRLAGRASAGLYQVFGGGLIGRQPDFHCFVRRNEPYRTRSRAHCHVQDRPVDAHFLEISEDLCSERFRQFRAVALCHKFATDFLTADEALLAVNDPISHPIDYPLLVIRRLDLMDARDAEGADDASGTRCQHERARRKASAPGGIDHAFRAGPPSVAAERLAARTGPQPGAAHGHGQTALADDLPHLHRSRYISAGRVHDYGQFPVADAGKKFSEIARRFRIDHALGGNPVDAALGPAGAGAGIGMNEHELHGGAGHLRCCQRRRCKERQSCCGAAPTALNDPVAEMREDCENHAAIPPTPIG